LLHAQFGWLVANELATDLFPLQNYMAYFTLLKDKKSFEMIALPLFIFFDWNGVGYHGDLAIGMPNSGFIYGFVILWSPVICYIQNGG
jgi:hypothetical protein